MAERSAPPVDPQGAASATGTGKNKTSAGRQVASAVLLVVAVAYLIYVIGAQWEEIGAQFSHWSASIWAGALAAALAMMGLKSAYHATLFGRLGQGARPRSMVIAATYAASQVVRYLPGKVLGIVYQSARLAPEVPAFRVIAANVVQGLYTNVLTIGVLASIAVWTITGSTFAGLGFWVAAVAFIALSHRLSVVERATARLTRWLPDRWHGRILPSGGSRWGSAALCASLLAAEWIPYFVLWRLLAPMDAGADPATAAILLGACYAGASIAASFAVLMPSGLFVREALFLFVASRLQFDPAVIVALGAAARVLLTLADLLLAPLLIAASRLAEDMRA